MKLFKKRFLYLHVSYVAQLEKNSSLFSDKFLKLKKCTLKELRQSIWDTIESETGRKVESLTILSITELSERFIKMLMSGETFVNPDSKRKCSDD